MKHLKLFENFDSRICLFVETFNGEGYTDPTVEVCKVSDIGEKSKQYIDEIYSDGYEKNINNLEDGYLLDISFVNEEEGDSGRIRFISIDPNRFYLVEVIPDINEFGIVGNYGSLEEAKKELSNIVNDEDYEFDQADVNEYEEGDTNFGSHTDNGYYHYEIIKS